MQNNHRPKSPSAVPDHKHLRFNPTGSTNIILLLFRSPTCIVFIERYFPSRGNPKKEDNTAPHLLLFSENVPLFL
jgi:hypothetical protein